MKLVCMIRAKNEARWIGRVIDSVKPLCSSVHVFDDNSTDATSNICLQHGADVYPNPFEPGIDETRDKNYLVKNIIEDANPDWVLHIDGDEELEPAGIDAIRDSISSGVAPAYDLQVLYLWDRPDQIRVDGLYRNFRVPSLFSTRGTNLVYASTVFGNGTNLHCSRVPHDLVRSSVACPARLLHYGYIDRSMRLSKYEFYNTVDPDNLIEDCYRHIVQGDIPEVPEYAKLKHAGPMKLEAFVPRTTDRLIPRTQVQIQEQEVAHVG